MISYTLTRWYKSSKLHSVPVTFAAIAGVMRNALAADRNYSGQRTGRGTPNARGWFAEVVGRRLASPIEPMPPAINGTVRTAPAIIAIYRDNCGFAHSSLLSPTLVRYN